jgi:serine/threonine protein phosphatase PrpC
MGIPLGSESVTSCPGLVLMGLNRSIVAGTVATRREHSSAMRLEATAWTDPGPVRDNNEDAFLVDVESGLFVVADGMGGHAAGEVASALAVEVVAEVLLGTNDPEETTLMLTTEDGSDALRERLRYCMNQASMQIRKKAIAEPLYAGMGTTLVVLMIEEDSAYLSHVGDSRIYLFRDGELQRLTRDHTVVQQEIDAGRLTPELARLVPHKNILTQSVGYHGPVEPDTCCRVIRPGDVFLLCSDGLTDPLDDAALQTLFREQDHEDLAAFLVQRALDEGTQDNTTVVVVQVLDD